LELPVSDSSCSNCTASRAAGRREPITGLSLWLGTALIVFGVSLNLFGGWRHLRLVRQQTQGEMSYSDTSLKTAVIAFIPALVGGAVAI